MTPTPEQQQIIDATVDDALKIIAYAGTGKTSTFVEYANARPSEEMLYLAFNKSVETEAKTKFKDNVLPKTVHALAYREIGRQYNNLGNLRYYLVAKAYSLETYTAWMVVNTLESFWNSASVRIDDSHVPPDNMNLLGLGFQPKVVEAAEIVWKDMQAGRNGLPMTHSGYLKLYQLSQPIIRQNTILLDEAQDTNPVTLDIVMQQASLGTKLLFCGDPYQQIYSWRGAIDAMDMLSADTLYLTQSFRFGPAVASVANRLLWSFFPKTKDVLGRPDIEDMVVDDFNGEAWTTICRTNVSVFEHAIMEEGVHIVGERQFDEFLNQLTDVHLLANRKKDAIRTPFIKFFRDFQQLCEFAEKKMDNELSGKVRLTQTYGDSIPSLVWKARSNQVPKESAKHIIVTGHKAKGLEWNNVELADDFGDLFDEKGKLRKVGEGKDEVNKDEINLLYVATTRAKRRLKLNGTMKQLMVKGQEQ